MNAAAKLALMLGLLFGGALNAQTPDKTDPETKPKKELVKQPETVPFVLLKSRHMAIDVKLNGKGPYRLIFDTGAPTNLVNTKLAKETGLLKKSDKGGLFGMAGAKTLDTLQIGDVTLEKVQVMVMDHPTVAAISNALGPIDGIVGFPFFARFKMTIDYQKKELTLVPNGYEPGDAMQALMDKMMSAQGGKQEPALVMPAGLWGFEIDKAKADDEPGVTVKDVLAGGPAALGGLKAGDRLLTLDGRWTDSLGDVLTAVSLIKPGRTITAVVKRDGQDVNLKVTPAKGF